MTLQCIKIDKRTAGTIASYWPPSQNCIASSVTCSLATATDTYMITTTRWRGGWKKRKKWYRTSSSDSDSSIKKTKIKKIKKPVWSKPVNPYVDTPAGLMEPITEYAQDDVNVVTVEQYDTSSSDEDEYDRRGIESANVDQPAMRSKFSFLNIGMC